MSSQEPIDEIEAPLIGIDRHRMDTDGQGVTTLVGFHGCPLRCRYCLNNHCHDPRNVWRCVTARQLLQWMAPDNLYFLATGGGIAFGGGEPLLHSRFIEQFCVIKAPQWRITLETSLHAPREALERVVPHVDHYCIDIKDSNPVIYHRYTQCSVEPVLENLQWLLSLNGMASRVVVRLPHIPHYNTQADVDRSRRILQDMGVRQFDEFHYLTTPRQ
ncbi:MAG: radical SAM protein [Muribaculaceae bacterium]|nr:radical SAM protein [Muribaculaceae bacterium]